MSKLEVSTIDSPSGQNTVTIGDSNASTITLKSGATLTNFPANTPAFVAYIDANQSLTNGTATKLTFTSESIDTDNAFADSKFTVPSGKAGKYFLHGKFRASSFVGSLNLDIFKNGSNAGIHFRTESQSAGNNFATCSIFGILDLSVSDYIEIYGYQFAGSTQNITSKLFEGYKLT